MRRINSLFASGATKQVSAKVSKARRDVLVLAILIGAVMLLIWNGSDFVRRLTLRDSSLGPELKFAWTAISLNLALILFGWRRYVDLQHEAERNTETEQRAHSLASTDAMTGLLNRKGFGDAGEGLRTTAIANGTRLVVLSIQLHRFKSVNDRHGFDVGDAVIRKIADEIMRCSPAGAHIARISGDEFAVLFTLPPADVSRAVETAETLLRSVTKPFEQGGKFIQVGAFVGIADSVPGEVRLPDLLRRADIAMDHARGARSARPAWFDAAMEQALVAHGEIEQGIRHGLEQDEFLPYFEPQVDLATGRVTGFEVLARWDHPLSGIIAPGNFISVAEENGLIGRLSDQVVAKALRAAAGWDPSISLSINISPTQLTDTWLAQKIVRLLTESGFPAERLVVEITESSLFADLELARAIVTSLKAQGIRLALDDFGTGFSSLSHLRALPFDIIKIDRSFVATLTHDRESAAIVRAVTTLALAIDVPVTVEGIEDAATFEAVCAIGCAKGQGWYFGKPMSAADAFHLIRHGGLDQASPDQAAAL